MQVVRIPAYNQPYYEPHRIQYSDLPYIVTCGTTDIGVTIHNHAEPVRP